MLVCVFGVCVCVCVCVYNKVDLNCLKSLVKLVCVITSRSRDSREKKKDCV